MSSSVSGLATDEPSSGSGYSDLDFASDGEENDEFANDEEEAADGTPRRRKSALAANRPPRLLAMENALCDAEEIYGSGTAAAAAAAAAGFRKVLALQDAAGGEEEACCFHAWRAVQRLCVVLVEKCIVVGGGGGGDDAAELFAAFRRFLRDSAAAAAAATPNQVEQGVDEILGAAVRPFRVQGESIELSIVETLHRSAIEAFAPTLSRLCQKIRLRLGYVYYETGMTCRLAAMLPDLQNNDNNKSDDVTVSTLALHMAVCLSQREHRHAASLFHDALRMQSCALRAGKPRVMGIVRECGAILCLRERRYFDARAGFWEAFKCFNQSGDDVQRVRCLKSLVVCEMLKGVYAVAEDQNGTQCGSESAREGGASGEAAANADGETRGARELLGATSEAQLLVGRPEMLEVFALSEAVAAGDVIHAEKLCAGMLEVLDPRLRPCIHLMLAEIRSRHVNKEEEQGEGEEEEEGNGEGGGGEEEEEEED
jgi:hypothetical protein